jgi:hypothetical protein
MALAAAHVDADRGSVDRALRRRDHTSLTPLVGARPPEAERSARWNNSPLPGVHR